MSSKKTWLGIVSALLFLGIGAFLCYIPLGQYQREKLIREFAEALPGNLAIETVSVDLLSNSVELEGVSGRVEYFRDMAFDIRLQKLRLEGVNWRCMDRPGMSRIADAVSVEHLSFTPDARFSEILGYSAATIAAQDIRDLWLDAGLLLEAGREGPDSRAFSDWLLSIRLGPTRIRDAGITISDRSLLGGLGRGHSIIALSRVEMKRYSLQRADQIKTWGYSQIYADGTRLSVKEMACASRAIPPDAFRLKASGLFSRKAFSRQGSLALLKEGYSLRELECRELLVAGPGGDQLYIPALSGDVDVGNGNLRVYFNVPDLWMSGSILADALADVDPRLGFLRNRKLHFSSLVDWKVEPIPGGALRLACHQEAHESSLGSLVLDLYFSGKAAAEDERLLPFAIESIAFEDGSLDMEDAGFLQAFYAHGIRTAGGEAPAPAKVAEARAAGAESIRNGLETKPAPVRRALSRFAVFLEKSGLLSVHGECNPPLPLQELFNSPEEVTTLTLKSVHTP